MSDEQSEEAVRQRPLQTAVLALPPVLLAAGGWAHRYMTDDGYIYLRVVNQLTAGNGPVFNAGERVEAYTSPLWLLILSIVKLVFGWVDPAWLAVIVGWLCTVSASVLAIAAASRLRRVVDQTASEPSFGAARTSLFLLPLGALVLAATPPMWWYATSGLETGLGFLWLAASFYAMVRATEGDSDRSTSPGWVRACLIVIGLGVVVRPDFLIFTVCFAAAVLAVLPKTSRHILRSLGWMFAVPAVYQVFRMGYFASLTPTTAIAKSASESKWERGWSYLWDFVGSYALLLPLAVVGFFLVRELVTSTADRRRGILAAAPIVGAMLSALYVVRLGGDYMHARFLMPAFFALMLPVSVVELRGRLTQAIAATGAVWACSVVVLFGLPRTDSGANLERYKTVNANVDNPITLSDYGISAAGGRDLATRARGGENVLIDLSRPVADPVPLGPTQGTMGYLGGIGVTSVAAGNDVWIFDSHGLADPLAARLETRNNSNLPGHEKTMGFDLVTARAAPPSPTDHAPARAFRQAVRCGDLARLYAATNDPLDVGRFLENIRSAPSLTFLEIPNDPLNMEKRYCG